MSDLTIWPDVELWLCRWLQGHAPDLTEIPAQIVISTEWPDADPDPAPPWCVVVRDDPGAVSDYRRTDRLGVTVIGPADDVAGLRTNRVALALSALIVSSPSPEPSCPLADVRAATGPTKTSTPEGRPARYSTFDATIVAV